VGVCGRLNVEDKPISQQFLESPQNWPRSERKAKEALVAVNFRVPFEFRQRMKLSAALRSITMTELMTAALEYYISNVPEVEASTGAGLLGHNSEASSLQTANRDGRAARSI
jgi:hypothetical protein